MDERRVKMSSSMSSSLSRWLLMLMTLLSCTFLLPPPTCGDCDDCGCDDCGCGDCDCDDGGDRDCDDCGCGDCDCDWVFDSINTRLLCACCCGLT